MDYANESSTLYGIYLKLEEARSKYKEQEAIFKQIEQERNKLNTQFEILKRTIIEEFGNRSQKPFLCQVDSNMFVIIYPTKSQHGTKAEIVIAPTEIAMRKSQEVAKAPGDTHNTAFGKNPRVIEDVDRVEEVDDIPF